MTLQLYNSLSRAKEEFVPRDEGKVGIYACGPTVYNLVHVGNARPYVTFAVLRSWLRRRGYEVTLVENITDVDDKIIAKANLERRAPDEVAVEFADAYHQDMERLGEALRPDVEPLATETIPEIIDLCCQLISRGHAYESEGSVYFRVRSFGEYGKLSRQRIEELEEGARVEGEPGKEDALDFAVWKAAKPDEPSWESPWGRGRPGWHIECSAMAQRYLGAGFDIHGGGRDLIFPHHENEIAQSEAAGLPFARYWMHNGMIRSSGEKMAKSVGNIFLLREVLDRYAAPVVLTYFLTTHYRSPLEFSLEKLDEAKAAYERLVEAVRTACFRIDHPGKGPVHDASGLRVAAEAAREGFAAHMDDDLNTAGALGGLFALAKELFRYVAAADAAGESVDADVTEDVEDLLVDSLDALCISLPDGVMAAVASGDEEFDGEVCTTENVTLPSAQRLADDDRWDDLEMLYAERLACDDATYACLLRDRYRSQRDFAAADRLRDEMQTAGFEVRDTPAGTQVVPGGDGGAAVRRTPRRDDGRVAGPRRSDASVHACVRASVRAAIGAPVGSPLMEWIYGRQVARLALAAGARRRPHRLAATASAFADLERHGVDLSGVEREVHDAHELERLTGSREHQGVALLVDGYPYADADRLARRDLVVVLDEVTDPRNVGAIARSALAAGAGGLALPRHRSAAITPAAVKASAGATEHLDIARVTNVVAFVGVLKAHDFWVFGAAGGGTTSYRDLDYSGNVALVFGAEGSGLRPLVRRACDVVASISVREPIDSLNVSVAAALFLFEAAAARTAPGGAAGSAGE